MTSTGVTPTQLEDYLLAQPGISPQLAADIKAIGDPTTTLPIPVPVQFATSSKVTVQGVQGVLSLDAVQREGSHGSWRRPVLLALPRADHALALFENLKSVLLANDGRLLSEIIQLMISVETIPLSKLLEDAQSSIELPTGVSDMVVPTGSGWMWLVLCDQPPPSGPGGMLV